MRPNHLSRAFARQRALACFGAVALASCSHAPADPPADPPSGAAGAPALSHHEVRIEDLPTPDPTSSAVNPPRLVARPPGVHLVLPPGFHIAPFAEGGFEEPRWAAVAPGGDVFVSDSRAGTLIVLRGIDMRGLARERHTFATGLRHPFGIAFAPGYVYVADTDEVVRFPYQPGDRQARGPSQGIAPLPDHVAHGHWTRNLLFAKDFSKLYVTVGSSSNGDPEDDPERATILEMTPDGRNRRVFASGLRNTIGLAWGGRGGDLWAAVQERDGLGDDLVPDYVTRVDDGAFYGWPWAYLGGHEDPTLGSWPRPDRLSAVRAPDLLLESHVAVMGLVSYDGAMFPRDWRGDLLMSFHGSWNRSRRVGYGLARARMRDGEPLGGYDDFVTGWMLAPDRQEVWGRPVGLAVLEDGSLVVVDDGARMIWRITYR
jgi:glucose/arabinose dehydrogenase